jgi:phosphatidylserine/phosphatidylglycerophosphate/cardiolipin synthase-like enzyme
VALLTLGNSRPDPRPSGKIINSEIYIHSKNMAVFGKDWTVMTGGSGNIAFTSMWFHSEMNIAFMDTALIKNWVAQLWSEHLQKVSVEEARELIGKPQDALSFFKDQAACNLAALQAGRMPEGRVYDWKTTNFPPREFDGIDLSALPKA